MRGRKKRREAGEIKEEKMSKRGGERNGFKKKTHTQRKIDSYVGYCSLTAPLLNFKREPWAEQRAEQRAAERRGKERRGRREEERERANGKLTLEANRRQAGEEVRNEIS